MNITRGKKRTLHNKSGTSPRKHNTPKCVSTQQTELLNLLSKSGINVKREIDTSIKLENLTVFS